jgi:hypothetical protein
VNPGFTTGAFAAFVGGNSEFMIDARVRLDGL